MLCAFPNSWPIDRTEMKLTNQEFQDMLKDTSGAPLFSCGRASETLGKVICLVFFLEYQPFIHIMNIRLYIVCEEKLSVNICISKTRYK